MKNLADYLLLIGVILIGIYIFKTYGADLTIFYSGVCAVVASLVFGFKPKPDKNKRRY